MRAKEIRHGSHSAFQPVHSGPQRPQTVPEFLHSRFRRRLSRFQVPDCLAEALDVIARIVDTSFHAQLANVLARKAGVASVLCLRMDREDVLDRRRVVQRPFLQHGDLHRFAQCRVV